MPTADDHGATGVAAIMAIARRYSTAAYYHRDDHQETYEHALEAAVGRLAHQRDEAVRNVDLLSAALAECMSPQATP